MFGIDAIADDFVPIFFGIGYEKVIILIRIISPILILMGIENVIGTQYLLPTKRQKEYTTSVTIGVIFNFFLNYILISLYQSIGASIATVLSQLIVDIIQLNYIKKEISFKELLKLSYKYFISSLVMFGVCVLVKNTIEISIVKEVLNNYKSVIALKPIISIILQIIFGMVTYILMLIILKDNFLILFTDKIKEKFTKNVDKKINIR